MSMLGKIRLKNECDKILTWSQRILALSERNVWLLKKIEPNGKNMVCICCGLNLVLVQNF